MLADVPFHLLSSWPVAPYGTQTGLSWRESELDGVTDAAFANSMPFLNPPLHNPPLYIAITYEPLLGFGYTFELQIAK